MKMYDRIKKRNGENFAKQIKDYHNGIFEIPKINEICYYAGRNAEPLLPYLISLMNNEEKCDENTDFFGDLLEKAGYNWIIADTMEKQDEIKKYFTNGESLCTFGTNRFKSHYMVNVWKKDAENIKREEKPTRDGEYGTSVMSIQMAKKGGFISIKNRYNHSVSSCDNTLNSNPDNIIKGLSDAFKRHFNVDFSSQKVAINGDYHIVKNMIVNYNYEINGSFIGADFYVKDGEIVKVDPNKELIIDYFLLNIPEKTLSIIPKGYVDGFVDAFNEEVKDKTIRISKDPNDVERDGEFLIIKLK
jgi:hypothetical protein